jgi:hypothetical protein
LTRPHRQGVKESLEDVGVSWVIRELEERGHVVEDVWRPDRELKRRLELSRRPDAALSIDGAPAVIEVTMFRTTAPSTAQAMGREIRAQVEKTVREAVGDDWSVLGAVVYEQEALLARPKPKRQRDAQMLADVIASVVARVGEVANHRLDSAALPIWARGGSVSANHRGRPGVSIYVMPPRPVIEAEVDAFLDQAVASKSTQHAGWGEGILSVIHGFYETADDLRAGLDRRGSCPWSRVYWVPAAPPPVLVSHEERITDSG